MDHLPFLVGLLKLSLGMPDGITREDELAIWLDSGSDFA